MARKRERVHDARILVRLPKTLVSDFEMYCALRKISTSEAIRVLMQYAIENPGEDFTLQAELYQHDGEPVRAIPVVPPQSAPLDVDFLTFIDGDTTP